jgi:hypothetical protein
MPIKILWCLILFSKYKILINNVGSEIQYEFQRILFYTN